MNKSIYSFTCILCFILLSGCAGLHRGIPKGQRHHRVKQECGETLSQTIVTTENPTVKETAKAPVQQEQAASEVVAVSNTEEQSDKSLSNTERLPQKDSGDTLFMEESSDTDMITGEALDSERVAKNAYVFSWLPIIWILFPPLLLVGIVGTAVCISIFNKQEYVTEKGIDYKRRAIRTVILTSVVPLVLLLLFIILVIALF